MSVINGVLTVRTVWYVSLVCMCQCMCTRTRMYVHVLYAWFRTPIYFSLALQLEPPILPLRQHWLLMNQFPDNKTINERAHLPVCLLLTFILLAVHTTTCLLAKRDLRTAACSGCIFLNRGDGWNATHMIQYASQCLVGECGHTIPILCPGRRQGTRWGGITDLSAGACIQMTVSYFLVVKVTNNSLQTHQQSHFSFMCINTF